MKRNYAYIDGSFNPKEMIYGCGGFVIDQFGKKHVFMEARSDAAGVKLRNVAGELLGARKAVEIAKGLKMKRLRIFYDYKGVELWPTGVWKAKGTVTREYADFMREAAKEGLKITYNHVKGHSGNPGNEEADTLAKIAVGLIKCTLGLAA